MVSCPERTMSRSAFNITSCQANRPAFTLTLAKADGAASLYQQTVQVASVLASAPL